MNNSVGEFSGTFTKFKIPISFFYDKINSAEIALSALITNSCKKKQSSVIDKIFGLEAIISVIDEDNDEDKK